MKMAIKGLLVVSMWLNMAISEGFGAKDSWDCFTKILTEPLYTQVLLQIDEKECETNVIDLNTMFRGIGRDEEDRTSFFQQRKGEGRLATYLRTIKLHSTNIQMISDNMLDSKIETEFKIPEDTYNNGLLKSIALSYNFKTKLVSNKDLSSKRENSYIFDDINSFNDGENDADKIKGYESLNERRKTTPEIEPKTFVDFGFESDREKEKVFSRIKTHVLNDKLVEDRDDTQGDKPEDEDGDDEEKEKENTKDKKVEIIKEAQEPKNQTENSPEQQGFSDNDLNETESPITTQETQLDNDEVVQKEQMNNNTDTNEPKKIETDEKVDKPNIIPEASKLSSKTNQNEDVKSPEKSPANDAPNYDSDIFIQLKDFDDSIIAEDYPAKPLYPIDFKNSDMRFKDNRYRGKTIFALQSRSTAVKTYTNKELVLKALNTFLLLPKCIQSALTQCNPDLTKVVKTCEKFHESSSTRFGSDEKRTRCISENLTVKLACDKDEDLINNSCYEKCPKEFKDVKLFCMKSGYRERDVVPYRGQNVDEDTEIMWGNSHIVTNCKTFGIYYEDAGIDFCRPVCPPNFKDSGVFCEKPVRFKHQPIFTFDESQIDNN